MIKEKLYEACLIHYVNSLNEPMLLSLSWQVKMLEALQDIEIASRVVGFDVDSDESLDDKYKKLNCEILPLDHDSSDFKLIEKYLLTTHAPTHKVGFACPLDVLKLKFRFFFSVILIFCDGSGLDSGARRSFCG